MRRLLLVLFALLVANAFASAQILADFEKDAGGFSDNGWGTAFSSVGRVADPTGVSTGVLKMVFDGTKGQKGAIQIDNADAKGAQVITYWIYLPANTPDSIMFQLWGQDASNWNWNWNFQKTRAKDIPKLVWYPLNFYIEQYRVDTVNFKFDAQNYKIGKMGLQIDNYDEKGADAAWTGDILVDNVGLVGAQPVKVADFETGIGDFKTLWGGLAGVSRVADPSGKSAGVLDVSYANAGGAFGFETALDAAAGYQLAFWVWIPAGMPDSIGFKVFAQDNANWAWNQAYYTAKDIPKGKWYPLYFDMEAIRATPNSKFDHHLNKIGKAGIEVTGGTWTGHMYVDNVALVNTRTGDKWVLADFNSAAGGTYGYALEGWASAGKTMSNVVDPANSSNRVLQVGLGLVAAENKAAFSKSNVGIYQNIVKKYGTALTVDVFFPSDIPLGAQVGFYMNGGAVASWTEFAWSLNDTTIKRGKWNTLSVNTDSLVKAGLFDTTKTTSAGIQIYYSAGLVTTPWNGSLLVDNLTVVGVPQPESPLASPVTTFSIEVDTLALPRFQFGRMDWVDNLLGSETYNVYISNTAITDLAATGVTQFASAIPHGQQMWGHRPFTANGDSVTCYYAVTATDGITETPLSNAGKGGPLRMKSSATAKAKYVSNFASSFVLDGQDNEFVPYRSYQLSPEGASGPGSTGWTSASKDINWKATFVLDNKYLYISADVTDNQLRTDTTQQAWQGDAMEFYFGFYNARTLKQVHPKSSPRTAGDWRIGFNCLGQTTLDGGAGTTVPGVESTVFQKLSGDGYIIEARIVLDSMAAGKHFTLANHMLMMLKIDCNDWDVAYSTTDRKQIAQWGVAGGNVTESSWLRPGTWGYLEVLDAPTAVEGEQTRPFEYQLMANYPNPFNPSTTVSYELKESVNVRITIYSILGQEVATLVNEVQTAGPHAVVFDARRLASGMYIYSIDAGSFRASKQMLLLK